MDEQMIVDIARALQQSEAKLFGYVGNDELVEALWKMNERRYLREARAAHSVIAGKVAELEADKARLDFLQTESDDLRCFEIPTGGDDADVGWRVVAHYMAEPCERIIGEVWHDNLRDAIDQARPALAPYPERR